MRGQDGSPTHEELALLFHALSDPVRLRAVEQLLTAKELACGEISTTVTKSTFTHHLRLLEDAGLVATRSGRGPQKLVSLSNKHASLWDWLARELPDRIPFETFGGRSA